MGILELIVFSSALNLDVFAASLYFGTTLSRNQIIPPITGVLATLQCLVFALGYAVGAMLGSFLGPVNHLVGAGILLLVGGKMLMKTSYRSLRFGDHNIALVYLGTATDTLMAGVSVGAIGTSLLVFLPIHFIVSSFSNFTALNLGKWLRRHIRFPVDTMTGIVMIALGISELARII